jgi:pleckstrin domain-containing family G protein 5
VSILDDASTSAEPYDDGGTRRARSVASSRISLFNFGKDKNEVVARLEEMKANSSTADFRDLELESHWKEIVRQDLPGRLSKQQEALWELVTTEKSYIDVLKNMADLKYYLNGLKRDGYLKDIDVDRIFRNYDELFKLHYQYFWQDNVMKMLGLSRLVTSPP